jgi:eukaryotic-like serine/threonine-protein kinase
MKSFLRFAMMALVLVVVALVSALTAMRLAIHVQEVQVPSLVGRAPAEAARSVAALGLQVQVERQYYSPQIPEGRIVSQLPLPGTKVRRGWLIRVAESLGAQRVVIPDVTKESERAAEWNIKRRGLDLTSTAVIQLPGMPADQVVAQSPPANANQVAAPRTSLLISAAPDSPAYVMPSFIGQALGVASRTLQDAGFKLGNVTIAPAPSPAPTQSTAATAPPVSNTMPLQPSPASVVIVQNPPVGQRISAGAVISFEVR